MTRVLDIRPEQQQALLRAAVREFARIVLDELRVTHAAPLSRLSAEEIERRLEVAVEKTGRYEIRKQKDIRTFVSLCIVVGPFFDLHPAFRTTLERADLSITGRLTAIAGHSVATDWQEAARMGPEDEAPR